MLPHREKHRRARLGKDIVADLECAALAHRRSNVKKGIGAAKLAQPIAAEIHRVEDQPLVLLEVLPECLIGQRGISGEVLELRAITADLADDLEYSLHDLLALVARLGERLANEELERRVRLRPGLQPAHTPPPALLTLDCTHHGPGDAEPRTVGHATLQRARAQQATARDLARP